MAEQDYPIEQLKLSTIAANDEFHSLDSEADTELTPDRLEARFLDANLLAANDASFTETASLSAYPVDAFYRACQRHLQFGPDYAAMDDAENGSSLVQDAPLQPAAPRATATASSMGKGPSYAL